MNRKTIVITGASDGIGAAAAKALSEIGANTIVVGRSAEKTKRVADELKIPYYIADLADFRSVRALADNLNRDLKRIDVLINNAGAIQNERKVTGDGHEMTLQVNHLSPFLLTHLLLPKLLECKATVITTSSVGNRFADTLDLDDIESESHYNGFKVYGASKLMNILFTKELHNRYGEQGLRTAAFHPGIVRTGFSQDSGGLIGKFYKAFVNRFFLSPEQGADTMVWLVTSEPGIDWKSGEYYAKRKVGKVNPQANDSELTRKLWELSANLTKSTL